jgi:PAS domain-containing protein
MLPPAHRLAVSIKQLFDAKEQGLFGAVTGALDARKSSERLLIGLSGLVLIVGLALALSLRQRVRKDFARAYQALTAEVEERTAAERALRASEERFRSLVQNSSDVISIVDPTGASATTASRSAGCSATTRPSWSTSTRSPSSTPTTASGWPGSWPRRPCGRG